MSSPAAAQPGLRERRRRETYLEFSNAAMDLFEQHGVHGTTVDDIARRAGASPRTFFRYFATKEEAIFASADESEEFVRVAIAAIHGGEDTFRAIEAQWMLMLDDFDDRRDEHTRFLRIRRLIIGEPTLLAVALRREAEQIDQLTEAAAQATDADPLTLRAGIATLALAIRLTFDEWSRCAELGLNTPARTIYDEVRAGIADLTRRLGADR
ncbi:TetR family transcriptional regulator [Microbacterium sp. SORGH_AS_0888]|uniref:TetR family transcriptional regulator n=1 Tax=Microbacterium sp. SORGH_AS_0888 TaxID=3041791 RepID=UPI0027D832DA|nr:TetR family transcriptional regulator [Microbacterium sp. SORGH_AS_0888]